MVFRKMIGSLFVRDEQPNKGPENAATVDILGAVSIEVEDWDAVETWWKDSRSENSELSASGVSRHTLLRSGERAETVLELIRRNAMRIENLDPSLVDQVADTVFRGMNERKPAREVARELSAVTGFERARSLQIASYQLRLAATALDTERMCRAGMEDFIWVYSGALDEVPSHKARDGKRYNFRTRREVGGDDEIPANDMPGLDPACKCLKRMVIDLEDVDDDGNPR